MESGNRHIINRGNKLAICVSVQRDVKVIVHGALVGKGKIDHHRHCIE